MLFQRINQSLPGLGVRNEFDRLLGNFLEAPAAFGVPFLGRPGFPAINVWEDGENLYAEAEVPGVKMSELEVSVLNDELSIKGERTEKPAEDASFHRRERGLGQFARTVRLPLEVDANRVEATLKDGVLTVKLPKSPAVLPVKIEVKS